MNTTPLNHPGQVVIVTEALRVWRFSYALECQPEANAPWAHPPFAESGWVNVLARNGEEAHRKFRERIRPEASGGKLELGEPVPVLEVIA